MRKIFTLILAIWALAACQKSNLDTFRMELPSGEAVRIDQCTAYDMDDMISAIFMVGEPYYSMVSIDFSKDQFRPGQVITPSRSVLFWNTMSSYWVDPAYEYKGKIYFESAGDKTLALRFENVVFSLPKLGDYRLTGTLRYTVVEYTANDLAVGGR